MHLSWRIRENSSGAGDIAVREDNKGKYETWGKQKKFQRTYQHRYNEQEQHPLSNNMTPMPTPTYTLRVNLLAMMNNEHKAEVFTIGPGHLRILRDLSEMFPPGNPDRVSIEKNLNMKSWIISQSTSGKPIKVTKLLTELYQGGETIVEEQGQRVEPTSSFLQMYRDGLRQLNLNIVTSRGVLKKLMILKNPCEIIVCKNEDNVLTIWNEFKKYAAEGIDVSTGTTFEEYLSERPKDIFEPVKRIYGIFHTSLGDSSVLYHAEVDALRNDIIRDPNRLLSTKDFVEVKTVSESLFGQHGQYYFFRQRLSEWWAQCALAGVEKVVCGVLNDQHQPYTFNSRFIEIKKFLHLKVSEFSNQSREFLGDEPYLWSEQSMTHQLKSALDQLRDRFQMPGIQNGKKYKVYISRHKDGRGGMKVNVGTPCEML